MGFIAVLGIVLVAILVGVGMQYLMGSTVRYEWLVIAVAGAFGAYLASETFVTGSIFEGIKDWGPELDGLFIVPAAIGGVLLALVSS